MNSSYQQLSNTQQIVLILATFPGAILSILGSTAIIYVTRKRRKVQKWTPYTRLLIAMSTCDILSSINLSFGTFLRPKETSKIIWAFGNDTTCNFSGFVFQATFVGMWYQGMLSIYFLLTTRYAMKNERIAKTVEPFMHVLALGYPIGTAIAGAVMDVYGERHFGTFCWVREFIVNRVTDTGSTKVKDGQREFLSVIFYAIPSILVLLCLIYTQLSIYLFVRRHTQRVPSQEESGDSASCNADVSLGWSDQNAPGMKSTETSSSSPKTTPSLERDEHSRPKMTPTSQSQRLKLVCSQAFLFVMAYFLCNIFNLIAAFLMNKARDEAADMELAVRYNYVSVLARIMMPVQGLFNFLIYIRPKYIMLRKKFPSKKRLSTVRQIFQGNQLFPTPPNKYGAKANNGLPANQQHAAENEGDATDGDNSIIKSDETPTTRFARNMISSLTASDGDFDSQANELLAKDDRWHDTSSPEKKGALADLASGVNRLSMLESIGETSESIFELSPYQLNGSYLSPTSGAVMVPTEPAESRWKGTETSRILTTTLGSSSVEETETEVELDGVQGKSLGAVSTSGLSDIPVCLPKRTSDRAINDSTMNPGPELGASNDHSSECNAKRQASSICEQKEKRVFEDVPLVLPERFVSLPPSEVEHSC